MSEDVEKRIALLEKQKNEDDKRMLGLIENAKQEIMDLRKKLESANSLYFYKAKVTTVKDGDTIVVDLDLGCDVILGGQEIRLLDIDTFEKRKGVKARKQAKKFDITEDEVKKRGLEAKAYLISILEKVDNQIMIKTARDTKGMYGRWLGTIYIGDNDINQQMITEGYAFPYES
jgi:micrococcal nuclease